MAVFHFARGAPHEWKLFLDPLLRQLYVTHDPYIIGNGDSSQALRVISFADDMIIISSTHRGYRTRMKIAMRCATCKMDKFIRGRISGST